MHITERHDLARNHACHAFLPVAPPEQVRYSGPPSGILASAGGARLDRHHETKTPALRGLTFLGIQFWRWVRLLRFGGWYALPCKIGHLLVLSFLTLKDLAVG